MFFSVGHVINYHYIIIEHLYRFFNFILPPQLECKLHEDRGIFLFHSPLSSQSSEGCLAQNVAQQILV